METLTVCAAGLWLMANTAEPQERALPKTDYAGVVRALPDANGGVGALKAWFDSIRVRELGTSYDDGTGMDLYLEMARDRIERYERSAESYTQRQSLSTTLRLSGDLDDLRDLVSGLLDLLFYCRSCSPGGNARANKWVATGRPLFMAFDKMRSRFSSAVSQVVTDADFALTVCAQQ